MARGSDKQLVFIMPGGAPHDIFRTFEPNTIRLVIHVVGVVEIDPSPNYTPTTWNQLEMERVISAASMERHVQAEVLRGLLVVA